MSVTPVFYKRNGAVITGQPVTVQSAEIRYVDIKQLLPERYRNERDWGGFSLTYDGFNREMWSQFRFLGVNGGTNVDEFFTVKSEARASNYEATWWMPEKSDAIVALGNITDTATSAIVTFSDGPSRTVSLAPHATELVRADHSQGEGPDSVVINVTGAAGSVIPTGLITAKNGSFNSVIRFYTPNAAKQPNLYANGFRVTGNTPHMVLKNTTANSIAVVPKFTPLSGSSPFSLPQVSLPANATSEVDLAPLLSAARSRNDLDVVSVEITNWAAPGSVVGSLYGINIESGVNYDIPLRDSGLVRTMTGSYPWKISNDFTTVVYITNISDQEAQFVGEVNSHGAKVAIDPRKLRPGETAVFDMEQFRDEQTPDASGNKLPSDATQGQFKWSVFGVTNGKLLLVGRAEMVSRTERISTSYSCNDPCPPYIWGWLDPFSPPIIIVNATTTQSSVWQIAYYDSGYSMGPYTGYASYSVESSNIWTDPSSGHTTTVGGDATGDGCVFADMGSQERYSWDGQNCYDNGFADPINDTGCAEVADASIYLNGSNVTGQTTNVIVGQQISLSIVIGGSTTAPDHIQWSVPGTRVANYVASNSSGTVSTLDNLQVSTITFYWVDGGDNRQVQMSCRVNGVQFDKTTTFNVKRPSGQISISTSTTNIGVDSVSNQTELRLGNPDATPGLTFTRTFTVPSGFAGSTRWVQVFTKKSASLTDSSGHVTNVSKSGLDDVYPYPLDPDATAANGKTSDSPALFLNGFVAGSVDFEATMYLLFRPTAGTNPIWVPLRSVSWVWTASATNSSGTWTVTSHSDPGSLSDGDCLEHPTWTGNAN